MTNNNLSQSYPSGEAIQVLKLPDALLRLTEDLHLRGEVYGWAYLVAVPFARELLGSHLTHSDFFLIIDNRQRRHAWELVNEFPRFHAWTWAYNRTLHSKTLLFPSLNVTWVSTQNMTLGSYTMSYNHAVRIWSPRITRDLLRDWAQNCNDSKIIPARGKIGRLPQ